MHTMDGKDTGSKLFVGGGYAIVQLQSAITLFFSSPPRSGTPYFFAGTIYTAFHSLWKTIIRFLPSILPVLQH